MLLKHQAQQNSICFQSEPLVLRYNIVSDSDADTVAYGSLDFLSICGSGVLRDRDMILCYNMRQCLRLCDNNCDLPHHHGGGGFGGGYGGGECGGCRRKRKDHEEEDYEPECSKYSKHSPSNTVTSSDSVSFLMRKWSNTDIEPSTAPAAPVVDEVNDISRNNFSLIHMKYFLETN